MQNRPFPRPQDEEELKEREAAGLWRAITLSRKIAEEHQDITLNTLLIIHKTLLETAFPEAAGRFRRNGEDVKKLACIEPPPGRIVGERIHACWRDFNDRFSAIAKVMPASEEDQEKWIDDIFNLAAWTQYQLAAIHPFCEGNGRMARLVTNMILIRFDIPPTRVKFEGEHKGDYLRALCQIDNQGDYEPLKNIIIGGAFETLEKEEKRRRNAQK